MFMPNPFMPIESYSHKMDEPFCQWKTSGLVVIVVGLLFYVHVKQLWSFWDGQITQQPFVWAD